MVREDGHVILNMTYKKNYKLEHRNSWENVKIDVDGVEIEKNIHCIDVPSIEIIKENIEFEHVLTSEEAYDYIIKKYKDEEDQHNEVKKQYEEEIKKYNEEILPKLIEEAKEKAIEDINRKKEEEEKKKERELQKQYLEKDKIDWINQHGSDYFKRAIANGFDCQRKYVIERAAKEFPDFIVDFDDSAEWNSRSCPSEKALYEMITLKEKGYNANVVWLTRLPNGYDDYDYYDIDPCEAVVIRSYLGSYDLIKTYCE
ncbi:hypothetical protein [Thermoanaerobacterium aotearoense]|uniref:hypothetical protein n=2 Tax=Thermoanaerobacterium TaxID=28895 RepID=UPI0004ACB8DF|nr:hypothetical protein [Thermoanaerobacterium aotearoense]